MIDYSERMDVPTSQFLWHKIAFAELRGKQMLVNYTTDDGQIQ